MHWRDYEKTLHVSVDSGFRVLCTEGRASNRQSYEAPGLVLLSTYTPGHIRSGLF